MLRNPHDCERCEATIAPGEEYAAVDALGPAGETSALLCVDCARAFREFLDGDR